MRFSLLRRGLLLAVWLLACPAGPLAAAETDALVVIVARDAPRHALARETLARIFLRRKTLWENGDPVAPVNLPASHTLRRLFSEQILGVDPEELDDYWNAQYFQGIFPPYVLASEEAVLRFVAQSPEAIGYVSACSVDTRVKILLALPHAARENSPPCPQK